MLKMIENEWDLWSQYCSYWTWYMPDWGCIFSHCLVKAMAFTKKFMKKIHHHETPQRAPSQSYKYDKELLKLILVTSKMRLEVKDLLTYVPIVFLYILYLNT